MKTLNIRLTADEIEAVKVLRAAGENVSALLREALISQAAKRKPRDAKASDVLANLDAIYERYPGPAPDYILRGVDTTNREQMSAYARERVLRGRGRKA